MVDAHYPWPSSGSLLLLLLFVIGLTDGDHCGTYPIEPIYNQIKKNQSW